MNVQIFDKQLQEELERVKESSNIDVQMRLKDNQTKERIQNQQKMQLNKQKIKMEKNKNRAEQNRQLSQEKQKAKLQELKRSRKTKDEINTKSNKIITKVYITHFKEIEEDKGELINRINREIASKLNIYSEKHNNHIEEIKKKSVKYNQNVKNKHDQYWEERKIEKNDKKYEIDCLNAQKYKTYQKYLHDKSEKYAHYYNHIEHKAFLAANKRRDMNDSKDEEMYKSIQLIRENGKTGTSFELSPKRGESFGKSSKQQFEERELMLQKQYENKQKLDTEKIMSNEKILLEEFDLFKKVNAEEELREKERQRNRNNIILIQELKDKKIESLNHKINKLKNESIHKKKGLI